MHKKYISPDFEKVQFTLSNDILTTVSQGEVVSGGGVIEEPEEGMEEP